jgi:uncharacterized protein YbjT (DUF2867 family)
MSSYDGTPGERGERRGDEIGRSNHRVIGKTKTENLTTDDQIALILKIWRSRDLKAYERHMEINGKTAILMGASGLVGGFCLQGLLAEPEYARLVLLNRRELPLPPHPGLSQKIVSFASLNPNDFAGADDIFCAFGTTIRKSGSQEAFRRVDMEYPLAVAREASHAGAEQLLLVSSVGADQKSKNFYLRTKGELEQEIGKLGFRAVHIFRPSLLLGNRPEFRLGERVVQAIAPLLNLGMIGGLQRYKAIPAATVGKAMAAAAKQGGSGTFIYEYDEIVRLAA